VLASSGPFASHCSWSSRAWSNSSSAALSASRQRRWYVLPAMSTGAVRQPRASIVHRFSFLMAFKSTVLFRERCPMRTSPAVADSAARRVAWKRWPACAPFRLHSPYAPKRRPNACSAGESVGGRQCVLGWQSPTSTSLHLAGLGTIPKPGRSALRRGPCHHVWRPACVLAAPRPRGC